MKNEEQKINVVRIGGVSVPLAVGGVVALAGLIVICEWLFGVKILARFSPTDSTMKINSGIVFFLFGLGLLINNSEKPLARAVAAI